MKLKDSVAIITGGSRGIGKAIADLFAREGATSLILDVNEKVGQETVDEIIAKGYKAKFFKADVSSYPLLKKTGEEIFKEFGNVDILINNAGITADSSLKKMTEEQFDRVMGVNLRGVFNCVKVFGLRMVENGKGSIVNASSVVSHFGNFGQGNYVATKAAVNGLTEGWAQEFGPQGVRVNAVAPGFVDTEMTRAIPEKIVKEITKGIPLRRFSNTEEIAKAYLYLASDDASYVNGTILRVDAGFRLGKPRVTETVDFAEIDY